MKRLVALLVGSLMLVTGLILAQSASAHTPSASLTCTSWSLAANSYESNQNNTYGYSLDGGAEQTGNFGSGFSVGGKLDGTVNHTLTAYVYQDGKASAQYSRTFDLKVDNCVPETTPPTSQPVTSPPVTSPPVTSPPVTSPPATSPPVTVPPVTSTPTPTTSVPEKPFNTPSASVPVSTPVKSTSSSTAVVGPPTSISRPPSSTPVTQQKNLAETGLNTGEQLSIGLIVFAAGLFILALGRRREISTRKH